MIFDDALIGISDIIGQGLMGNIQERIENDFGDSLIDGYYLGKI